jgi:hypothetical protein
MDPVVVKEKLKELLKLIRNVNCPPASITWSLGIINVLTLGPTADKLIVTGSSSRLVIMKLIVESAADVTVLTTVPLVLPCITIS